MNCDIPWPVASSKSESGDDAISIKAMMKYRLKLPPAWITATADLKGVTCTADVNCTMRIVKEEALVVTASLQFEVLSDYETTFGYRLRYQGTCCDTGISVSDDLDNT